MPRNTTIKGWDDARHDQWNSVVGHLQNRATWRLIAAPAPSEGTTGEGSGAEVYGTRRERNNPTLSAAYSRAPIIKGAEGNPC